MRPVRRGNLGAFVLFKASMKNITAPSVLAALAVIGAPLAAAAADAPPAHHIRGTVTAVTGDTVTIKTADGPVVVTTGPKTKYAGVLPASASDIMDGTFIGTANVEGTGPARALEVVVFPPAMAGTGEGDYPWDLPAGGGHMSTMTNGTVAAPKMSSMTNGTVSSTNAGAVKTVKLTYKGGTKTVSIGPGTPIVRVVPGDRALLAPGVHVVAFPPVGSAPFIVIGEKGTIPPM
jgi:hypothetical protein